MALAPSIITELRSFFMRLDGKNVISGAIIPNADETISLGSATKKFYKIYAKEIVADNIGGGSTPVSGGDADTVDSFHATATPVPGNLLALDEDGLGNGIFPISVYPMALLTDGSRNLTGNLSVDSGITIDGVNIGAHDHSAGGATGVQIDHHDLLNLNADDHPQYTQWAQPEDIIEDWAFSNTADSEDTYYRYIGWKFETVLTLIAGVPDPANTYTSFSTLAWTGNPAIEHDYHIGLKAHGEYSQITIGGSESNPDIILYTDDSDTYMRLGTGSTAMHFTGTGSYLMYYGTDPGTSVFSVTTAGKLTSTSANIGGWNVDATKIASPISPQSTNIQLKSTGEIFIGTGDESLTLSAINTDASPGPWMLWAGNAVAGSAPFAINNAGEVYMQAGIVNGYLRSQNYSSESIGWHLSQNGDAEFNNIYARGRLETVVFSKRTISAASGIIDVSVACVLMEDVTKDQTYIVVDTNDFSVDNICVLKPDANRLEWMRIASYATDYGDYYRYDVVRDLAGEYDGGDKPAFYAGESIVKRGSGSSVRSAFPLASGEEDSVFGIEQPSGSGSTTAGGWLTINGIAPYFGVSARYGPLYDQYIDTIRIGNLKGIAGYEAETWGFYVGDANNYMSYDQANGLAIHSGISGYTSLSDAGVKTDAFSLKAVSTAPDYAVDWAEIYFQSTLIGTEYDQKVIARMASSGASNAEVVLGTDFLIRPNSTLHPGWFSVGRDDKYDGGFNLYGSYTRQGGWVKLYNAADSDDVVDAWEFGTYDGDFYIYDGSADFLAIRADATIHRLEIGSINAFTLMPGLFAFGDDAHTLGGTAGNRVRYGEFQGYLGNNYRGRLRLDTLRREVSTTYDWEGAVWRWSVAMDNSYTDDSKAYLDLGFTTGGDGVIALGTGGADRIVVSGTDGDVAIDSAGDITIDATGNVDITATDVIVNGDSILGGKREMLTADRTYYVRTDGSDSNDGLTDSSGGAFLTVQHAVDVAAALDTSIYSIVIQVGNGTWVENISCANIIGSGEVTIQGDLSTPSNVIWDGQFSKNGPGTQYNIKGFKFVKSSTTKSYPINVNGYGQMSVSSVDFGSGWTYHMVSQYYGYITGGNYTISAGAGVHWNGNSGHFTIAGTTITLTGTPNFTTAFLYASGLSNIVCSSNTYSGSATGKRYQLQLNTVCNSGGVTLPGNVAGTVATGAQYI